MDRLLTDEEIYQAGINPTVMNFYRDMDALTFASCYAVAEHQRDLTARLVAEEIIQIINDAIVMRFGDFKTKYPDYPYFTAELWAIRNYLKQKYGVKDGK